MYDVRKVYIKLGDTPATMRAYPVRPASDQCQYIFS